MKTITWTSCVLVSATAALLLTGGAATATAPGPQIAASSCGGAPVPAAGNAFCSFDGSGANVVIARGSCNVAGACLLLGNGSRIGHDSCNADAACGDTATFGGSSVIGNGSCNAEEACAHAGN